MWLKKLFIVILITFLLENDVSGIEITKSSLTFVIDDTGSMYDDIDQVKDDVYAIFETVLSSNESQIEDFVLVTFNDPTTNLRVITKDRDAFKKALDSISVGGGGDCPENALSGIEVALENSLPLSYLYVFTDASAKDYHEKHESVKAMALKKQCQVVFVLTGICAGKNDKQYQVYYHIANATNGQVFNVEKREVKEVLKFVKRSIKGRFNPIAKRTFPPGTHSMEFETDKHMGDVTLSVTGDHPRVSVTGPDGKAVGTEEIINTSEVKLVSIPNKNPGRHEATVSSSSSSTAAVLARSIVNFEHGFSVFKPKHLLETSSRPQPGTKSFLSIKLNGDGIKLNKATLHDDSGKLIQELPLELISEKQQLYVTKSFEPPPKKTLFKITVTGKDSDGASVTRQSATYIQMADIDDTKPKGLKPQVNLPSAEITTDYGAPLELNCRVQGYPKPDVIWQETGTGIAYPSNVTIIDIPYDFISTLKIDKANKNETYSCKATNLHGDDIKYVNVKTKVQFTPIEIPKDVTIAYGTTNALKCKFDANPPAHITWYKDGIPVVNQTNIHIARDNTVLAFTPMLPELQGQFMCEARNDFFRQLFSARVTISGLVKPFINKTKNELHVLEGGNMTLTCQVMRATPKADIAWYYRRKGTFQYRKMTQTDETFNVINSGLIGEYKCIAKNIQGQDSFAINVVSEYPPQIRAVSKFIRGKVGDTVTAKCPVTASPRASVQWFKGSAKIESSEHVHINADNTLSINATLADIGDYTCVAENLHGSTNRTVYIDVIIPPTIEKLKSNIENLMVGDSIALPCKARGFPKPSIKWTFQSTDTSIAPKDLKHSKTMYLDIEHTQLKQQGNYTCKASNVGGTDTLTYEVNVFAPPEIENVYKDKTFEVIDGDTVLIIKCQASGTPKPEITWLKDDLNIAMGTEWYDMEEDGTLVIKSIDDKVEGIYTCLAKNKIGSDTDFFQVVYREYPSLGSHVEELYLEEGSSSDVKCSIPYTNIDALRWYKDYKLISAKDLKLKNVTKYDEGFYTCRVSDMEKSRTETTYIKVGSKPVFINNENERIDFQNDDLALLSCEATGEPVPKVTWKHNGKPIKCTLDVICPIKMTYDSRGSYECEVSNKFGTIRRPFHIKSRDCLVNIKNDFPDNQPMMLSLTLTWPDYDVVDNYMTIPHKDYFYLHCPRGFKSNLPSSDTITAFCEEDSSFLINGKLYNYSDIQCKELIEPSIEKTGTPCLDSNSELIKLGYNFHYKSKNLTVSKFIEVFDICFDKDNKIPLYSQYAMSLIHVNSERNISKWLENSLLPFDFKSMYDCRRQNNVVSLMVGRDFHSRDGCCFDKRQLVNSKDLEPGIPASISHSYLNIVPHWSTCNSRNWDELENRIRQLIKSAGRGFLVTTGTAKPLHMPRHATIDLFDAKLNRQPVAQYLWKVVEDPASDASLAIIQVNVPDLTPAEVHKHILCDDICENIGWMKANDWRNITNGYTYCCTLSSFKDAFGFSTIFGDEMENVLFDTSLTTDHWVLK